MTHRSRSEIVELVRESAANLEYFFSHLQDATWLPFLLEEGFFENPTPPKTRTSEDGQRWISYPNWPESQYLARIAADDPNLVFEAIERIPGASNPRIHEDIVTAATAMPGELAAKIARREQKWLKSYDGHLMAYADPAGNLITHLAKEGEVKAALGLAGRLLAISATSDTEGAAFRQRAVGRVSEWEYGKIVEKAWPPLMEAEPEKAFRFLCHELANAIRVSVGHSSFDNTHMWRAAIEDHAQNAGHSLLDTLVDAVRDTALRAAKKGLDSADLVFAELARHDAILFRRLELFLLARVGSNEQVTAALTAENRIDDPHVWHEYAELLKELYGGLNPEQQAQILRLIAAGPDRQFAPIDDEHGETEEELDSLRRHWRLERYVLIGEHLTGEAAADYEALVAEFGKPDHPTFRSMWFSYWRTPTSPYTVEELSEMGPVATLEALRTWIPSTSPEGAASEGLARALQGAVEEDPQGFAEIAPEFADLNPDYVRGLLAGLAKAAKSNTPFTWEPALDLCEQVTTTTTGEKSDDGDDPSRRLRSSTVNLISNGLHESDTKIPHAERAWVWDIIEVCLDDPDPSAERNEALDPITVAINSVRGEALHAAMRYALWVERELTTVDSFAGIDSIPELAGAVDRRLDPEVDSSPAIRAVLGQWFVQFVRMDKRWAESLAPKIFPSKPEEAAFFAAAWNAYVVFNQPWVPVFEILRDSYGLAVERLGEIDEEQRLVADPREHLGDHLFHLQFLGEIGLDNESIFTSFWETAPVEVRSHALRHVGRSLEEANVQLSPEIRGRIVKTWEWVFDRSHDERNSIASFGAWFGGRQLDDGWLLAHGRRVLELGVHLDPDHVVYKALARMADSHPGETVEVLRLMIVNDAEGWSVLGSLDDVRQALKTALDSSSEVAATGAIGVVHLLGARGMNQFRDLVAQEG